MGTELKRKAKVQAEISEMGGCGTGPSSATGERQRGHRPWNTSHGVCPLLDIGDPAKSKRDEDAALK